MMGIISSTPFRTYVEFPKEIIDRFIAETGCGGILVNKPASGTEVIEKYGPEHQRTGYPIVYTSADSVLQLACHMIPSRLKTQYKWCEIARTSCKAALIGRIIARPFTGVPGNYKRLSSNAATTALSLRKTRSWTIACRQAPAFWALAKSKTSFDRQGISHAQHTGTNLEGLEADTLGD